MLIGMTYDLKDEYIDSGLSKEDAAEFDSPDTIEGIEHVLQGLGYDTDRIGHIQRLAERLVKGDRWDLVFNIAEGLKGFGREAQVPSLLDAYNIPYTFSDPLALSLSLHKGMFKRVIRDLGIPTPPFYIVESETDIKKVTLPFPLFAKPVSEGTGKGISIMSKIHNHSELSNTCLNLLDKFNQPVLVETFLPGREFTVGIVGTGDNSRCIGIIEVYFKDNAAGGIYSFSNKENYSEVIEYRPVNGHIGEMVKQMAMLVWRGLGCRDAGRIDLRIDSNGVPNVMELNPLAGLNPRHSDLPIICNMYGISYFDLIRMIMDSAIKRVASYSFEKPALNLI